MKILLSAILALLLAASPVEAAITVGNTASVDGTVSQSISLTIGAGADRFLLVGIARRFLTDVSAVAWNTSEALTKLGQDEANSNGCELWYVVNPTAGSFTVDISSSGHFVAIAMALAGVHQTTPLGTIVTANGAAPATSSSVNVSSASGELVVDMIGVGYAGGTPSSDLAPGAGQTENDETINADFATASGEMGSMSRENGAATTTMSWTWTTGNRFNQCAVAVKPAGAVVFRPAPPIFLD